MSTTRALGAYSAASSLWVIWLSAATLSSVLAGHPQHTGRSGVLALAAVELLGAAVTLLHDHTSPAALLSCLCTALFIFALSPRPRAALP